MNSTNRQTTSLFVLCCLVVCLGNAAAGQVRAALPPGEQNEYELVQKRLRNHEDLLTAATWTLCHAADEKEIKGVEKTLNLLQAFADNAQIPKLIEAGGVKRFKDNVGKLLENSDPVIRGFGAVLLAIMGDEGYKSEIARLLEDKRRAPRREELLYNFDRSRAAMALGPEVGRAASEFGLR